MKEEITPDGIISDALRCKSVLCEGTFPLHVFPAHFPHFVHFKGFKQGESAENARYSMNEFRFTLQAYKGVNSRYTCPQCGRPRAFVRYVDKKNKIQFPEYVGRCNREDKCGYHYTPKQYFSEHPEAETGVEPLTAPAPILVKSTSFIDAKIVARSLNRYENNYLFVFLCKLFDRRAVQELMHIYNVGMANHWKGSTVFWQTDIQGRFRTGKIMLYNPDTGRRVKQPHNHITWVHTLLKYEDFNLKQCFFGMHLLRDTSKPIAIVESEKTAMIASLYMPEYIWIASGGKNGCMVSGNNILRGRKVVLFPDINAFDDWEAKARQLKANRVQVELSSYLEEYATDEQRREGYDIADFLIQSKPGESVLEKMVKKNPSLALLIEQFNLMEVMIRAASRLLHESEECSKRERDKSCSSLLPCGATC